MTRWHTIGEASAASGLSIDTLRYYEQLGLLRHIARTPSGQRRYSDDDLSWLAFVNRLRATAMPLADMLEYVRLVELGDQTIPARRTLLAAHAAAMRAEIATLRDTLDVVEHKLAHYDLVAAGLGEDAACPVHAPPRNRLLRPEREQA